ncbi:MAG: alpha-amylase, partial [Bacteroidales bacterium]|nr:alpha-amylase [Bacteroidales bacterium]
FGEHNVKETGIFDFLAHLPGAILKKTPFKFMTPTEVAENLQPVSAISVPSPISWADEEHDITAWRGNELQVAALDKLYQMTDKVANCNDDHIKRDWDYLQASDHFHYMATKFFSDGAVHAYFNPYETPYEAFMNYMNVLSDFEIRLNRLSPETNEKREMAKLNALIIEKEKQISQLAAELEKLRKKGRKPATGLRAVANKELKEETKSKTGKNSKNISKKK